MAWYVVYVGKRDGAYCGARLLKRVGEIMKRLGAHLRLEDGSLSSAGRGDIGVCEEFLEHEIKFKPKEATVLLV